MTASVPIVEYLVLGEQPHLAAQQCTTCGAHYFDRRDACAACFNTGFTTAEVSTSGTLQTYTIVAVGAPGVQVPFVAGVIDCDGISVRANIVNVDSSAETIALGMALRLTTFPIGTDDNGATAVGFGFEPASNADGLR
jgi:uncharacterized OB-fold protein